MKEKYFLTVCTLGDRPNLTNCLNELLKIKHASDQDIEVLLVINKAKIPHSFDSEIIVKFEEIRGYSSVRNRAVSEVSKDGNLIFIDDDELPTLEWFNSLISMHNTYPVDVIFGPVFPELGLNSISYREQFKTKFSSMNNGALAKQASTANMLIPRNLLNRELIYFDPIFNLTGSEDTDLCFRLRKKGINIRFAKAAEIYEVQSSERFDSNYLDARYIKDIANYSLVIRRNCSITEKLWRFLTLVARIVIHFPLSFFIRSSRLSLKAHSKSFYVLITGKVVGKNSPK
jgi:GT2 family glycosyltransferase